MNHGGDPPEVAPDVPEFGRVRPPAVYLTALVAGALLQLALPLRFLPRRIGVPLGAVCIVVAIALLFLSAARFRAAGTPVPARAPTTAIVRTGPYRFSRNPIYLAFSVFLLGVAMALNSAWLLVTLAAAVAIMHFRVIPREEEYLERRFGAVYLDYKRSVRRWL